MYDLPSATIGALTNTLAVISDYDVEGVDALRTTIIDKLTELIAKL